jgi:multisubunit Na+/H+ antiporter MnhB subunit
VVGVGSEVNVDPAALLGAGAAAVIALVASNGPWTLTELAIGLALLFLLFAFGKESQKHPRHRRRLAWHAIAALCGALVLAFPLQQALHWPLVRDTAGSVARSSYPGCSGVGAGMKVPFERLDGETAACLLEVTTDVSVLVAAIFGAVGWWWTRPKPPTSHPRLQDRLERPRQRGPRGQRGPLTRLVASRRVPGAVALLLATGLVLYLLRVRGDPNDNLTGLLVELTGVCVEVVLIALVVDQLADARERRRWASLHAVLESTIHRCIVDMMRLNYLFVVPRSPDESRREEFIDLVRFSLGDLRSQVESFTASLELEPQEMLRSIERKLNYLLRSFHSISRQIADGTPPDIAYETHAFFASNRNWSTLAAATSESWSVLAMLGMGPDPLLVSAAERAAEGNLREVRLDAGFPEQFYQARFRAQDALLHQSELDLVLLDASGPTNAAYFALDHLLLSAVAPVFDSEGLQAPDAT